MSSAIALFLASLNRDVEALANGRKRDKLLQRLQEVEQMQLESEPGSESHREAADDLTALALGLPPELLDVRAREIMDLCGVLGGPGYSGMFIPNACPDRVLVIPSGAAGVGQVNSGLIDCTLYSC